MAVAMTMTASPSAFLGHFPTPFGKSQGGQCSQKSNRTSSIKALFWEPRKTVDHSEVDVSLGYYSLNPKGGSEIPDQAKKLSVSVVSSISEVSSNDWDACSLDATGPEQFNPFLTHGFLSSLEESGSAVKETGWIPRHIIAKDEHENILGVVPLYLKSHSYGEYVFDHGWADAYYSYGSRYYPKLQCCVPFTPVTGQRILVRNSSFKDQVFDILVSAMKDLANKFQVSSLHITFPSESEWQRLKERGFLQRTGMQYHWKNRNYKNFDEFLMDMKQSKRKNIRQERKKISAQNLTMKRLRGYEITLHKGIVFTPATEIWLTKVLNASKRNLIQGHGVLTRCNGIYARHWDTFYKFYRNTTDNKWGTAYLTRDFFHNMGSKMGDDVLLVVAEEGDELVAGALNLIGGDTLFGRLWGCIPRAYYQSLHFEACYYQAIEAAIELNLEKVEAGAQGEHKIQRGYLPVTTYSCHYILDEGFREVINNFLVRETAQVKLVTQLLHDSGPFKDGIQ